jgi:hypothetical protein
MILSLLFCEGALQLTVAHSRKIDDLLSPAWTRRLNLADSVLVWRGNPKWFDHDSRGFRNPSALDRADVVMLGDSHTYGLRVARSESWPSLVGKEWLTYNMAFGGWGPGQAYLELRPALALHPRLIVFGLYLGNDFFDAFWVASRRSELRRFIPTALADTTASLEARRPIATQAEHLFALSDESTEDSQAGTVWSLRRFLSEHSRLYGLARAVHGAMNQKPESPILLSQNLDQALAAVRPDQRKTLVVYRGADWQGLLTPAYRNLILDDGDPRIRAGIIATTGMVSEMDSLCRLAGAKFLVVLLPTKESVFAPRIPPAERTPSLDSLVENERRGRAELTASLDRKGIAWLDVLSDLRASPAQPYFPDADGHPDQVGHQIIAQAVLGRIPSLMATPH